MNIHLLQTAVLVFVALMTLILGGMAIWLGNLSARDGRRLELLIAEGRVFAERQDATFRETAANFAEAERIASLTFLAVHDVDVRTKLMEELLKGPNRS